MNIDKNTAKKLYEGSPEWFQEQLENEFGSDFFKPNKYESIKTFEDACAEIGIAPGKVFSKYDTPDEVAYKKLKIIAKAINNEWVPNWDDTDQRKWFPWFRLSSGFGFSHSACACDYSVTIVGSRLCFETKEQSDYAANQFTEIYKELLTIEK